MADNDERLKRVLDLMESDPASFKKILDNLNGKTLIPHSDGQREVLTSEDRFMILCAGRRWGKAIPHRHPVLTPNGWAQHGSLKIGDYVIGRNGHPTKVKAVFPQGNKDEYEITFSDGSSARCCDEHLWEVEKRKGRPSLVMSLREIIDYGLTRKRADDKVEYSFRIPTVDPVQFVKKDFILPPYSVGAFIGDGAITQGPTLCNIDQDIIDRVTEDVSAFGTPNIRLCKKNVRNSFTYREEKGNPLWNAMKSIGIAGHKAETKFIPHEYKTGSVSQREALLQGLLDTDGNVDKSSLSRVEYCTVSRQLAKDVQELIWSFGGVATIRLKPTYRQDAYIVRGRLPKGIKPFYCKRKADQYSPAKKFLPKRSIVDVKFIGKSEMQCIEVEAEDSLYVLDQYVVTHNTKVGAAKILRECRTKPKTISWWVSPTYRVVKRGYDEVVNMIPTDLLAKPAPASSAFDAGRPVVLNFVNGSRMEFFSAERPQAMLGGSCDFLIMDEAATMKENVWTQNIAPTLADRQGRALFISTPRGRNWFYYLWLRGQSKDPKNAQYKSWHFPSKTNPTIPSEEFDDMANRLPQHEYEQEILAAFISKSSSVFNMPVDQDGYLIPLKEMVEPRGHVVLGVDLAKRDDYTVLCGVNMATRLPCYNESFNQISWSVQRQRIHTAVNQILMTADAITILMDTGGVGDVVFDDLTEEGLDIIPINFTSMKDKMVKLLSADLERGRAFICEEQLEEFEHYAYTLTERGKWKYEAASGHDDQVSAALLAHWGIVNEGTPNVQTITVGMDGEIGGEYHDDYAVGTTERFTDNGGSDLVPAPTPLEPILTRPVRDPTPEELMRRPEVWGS